MPPPPLEPTPEQVVAVERFSEGNSLKINAFAGTGKTKTLEFIAGSTRRRGLYLAFNKSIANEASEKFPRHVECRTTHSIAFRAISANGIYSSAKLTSKIYAKQLAEVLNLEDKIYSESFKLTGPQRAFLMLSTVRRYCQSGISHIDLHHFPRYGRLLGVPKEIVELVRRETLVACVYLWRDMVDATNEIPLGHDGYLKLWALRSPKFTVDYILLDEAQDTNEVVLEVLRQQDAQMVYVGDRHQQIYEWRGAVNAMEKMVTTSTTYLTHSFRFGQQIASLATRILQRLGERNALKGHQAIASVIGTVSGNHTVLTRTNAMAISEILDALDQGERPHVVGGVDALKRLISDVYSLKKSEPAKSPEFFGFSNWSEVVEFANSDEGEDLKMFVQLVEKHGDGTLWAAVRSNHEDEATADRIISTAHKAKGREWPQVRIAMDFLSSRLKSEEGIPTEEIRLFYVAITRAKQVLEVDRSIVDAFAS